MTEVDNSITAESRVGRTLLALRAGPMSSGELGERFPCLPSMRELVQQGLVAGGEDGYRLTDAGRAACPLRNPLAGTVASPVSTRRPERPQPKGDSAVARDSRTDTLSAVKQLSGLLDNAQEGISRKDLIKKTGLTPARVDNAITNLIKSGKAERKAYGVIAPIASGITSMAARMQVKTPAIAEPIAISAAVPLLSPAVESSALEVAVNPEVDFMIHADGRLTIDYGDEIFVLPPDARNRLYRFLGRFEQR